MAELPDPTTLKVCLIGDGSMATVLGMLLESKGVKTQIWGAFEDHVAALKQTRESRYLKGHQIPQSITLTSDDDEAFAGADIIVSAVPTQHIRSVWQRLSPKVPASVPICSVAKGIETETMLRPTQIIADVLQQSGGDDPDKPARPLASICGPSVADELARCLPATVCVASDDENLAAVLQHVFTTSWFRVYTNRDLLGVELAGALKNCIAVAAGIIDGLHAGNNAKSALLARGLAEITRLGVAMGASAETFFGLTGVGDLATTCFSPTGRNRTAGEMLGQGKPLEEVLDTIPGIVEGVPTAKAVMKLAERYKVEMPITEAVYRILFDNLDPIEAIGQLMTRQPKAENVG